LLFVLLLIVIVRSITLPGAGKGIEYYLIPDFSKLNGRVILAALTQAFFSLGVGWGMMITYGSYLKKDQNIVTSSLWIGAMDTSIAFLAGFTIFPAVFAFNQSPDQGATLVFNVLSNIFQQMPLGNIAGALFFLLLFFAAITSTISMLEAPSAYFIDQYKWNRKKAGRVVALAAFLFGIPSALSTGAVDGLSVFQVDFLGVIKTGVMDIFDYLFGSLFMMLVVLSTCLFTGWFIKTDLLVDEIEKGMPSFKSGRILGIAPYKIWVFMIRFVCPIIIGIVILNMIGVFG
jgi:NSS family neurotransmitter:Na+ symporter